MSAHRKILKKDLVLATILKTQPTCLLELRSPVWVHLCGSIMSQQLSTKVAAVIYDRFLQLFPKQKPTLKAVMEMPYEQLRSIGLSNAKTQYVRNVCLFFTEEKLTDARLRKMSDEQLIETLTQIKGVGKWTVEMILMFTLAREDVFAVDDLGIQQAMIKAYQLNELDKKQLRIRMQEIAEQWRPYRTYACRYLWGWKDAG
jgi:DNA-3-methyladenine glycosylase II